MEFFQKKPELIAKYAIILMISSYIIEFVIIYWWNTHDSMIYISTFIYVEKMLTNYNLNYFQQTTGSILHIDYTYKFTKYFGTYQKSIELSKILIWIVYSVKVLIFLDFLNSFLLLILNDNGIILNYRIVSND
jgi:hypothetical protein